MKQAVVFFSLVVLAARLSAQNVYTITADSTRLTGCDSNELIIENHTQEVPGFLFNTGRGRTMFKRPLTKISDTLYLVGVDTLRLRNAWVQGGNAFATTGKLGTLDSNHLDIYTNSIRRGRWTANGNLVVDQQVQVGNFTPGAAASFSGATMITQGEIRATKGFNLRDPMYGDNGFYGVKMFGANTALWSGSAPQLVVFYVGANSSGSVAAILAGLNPISGNGIVNVLDLGTSSIQMIAGSNSITYNFLNLSPGVDQGTFGTGITRGLYINPNLISAADWRSIETVKGDNRLNTSSGKTGIGVNGAPTSKLDVSGDNGYSQFRMRTTYTPASSADNNGNTGDFSWDGNYFYIKTPSGWKRAALTTF